MPNWFGLLLLAITNIALFVNSYCEFYRMQAFGEHRSFEGTKATFWLLSAVVGAVCGLASLFFTVGTQLAGWTIGYAGFLFLVALATADRKGQWSQNICDYAVFGMFGNLFVGVMWSLDAMSHSIP